MRRLETIRNIYISTSEHAPNNLELIFALAHLKEHKQVKSRLSELNPKLVIINSNIGA